MVPEEDDRVERWIWGLPDNIQRNVTSSAPTRLQDVVRMANNLMDQKVRTNAARQIDNKRKWESQSRDNRAPQKPFRSLDVLRAYISGNNEKIRYAGNLSYCNKCRLHHARPCIVKAPVYNQRNPISNQRASMANQRASVTCFECGRQGDNRQDCPKLKNQNGSNQATNVEARRRVFALGRGDNNKDSNVGDNRQDCPKLKNQNRSNQATNVEARRRVFALGGGDNNKDSNVVADAADSGPIFDTDPLQKVSNDDHYNVFAIDSEHPEQSKSIHDTYSIEQDEHNVIIDSLDMSYDREQIDQNDDDADLVNEHELLASLIEKLKCEIDDSKNRNKFLETSNKVLIEKLKGKIEYFKNKNKSLESLNNHLKEANNKLSETNNLMYADFKKSQAELARRNNVESASKVEINCAKARGDLISYNMESQKSFNKYTQTINDLNQTISEMKEKLRAHQETISILSQQKEAQIKLYKTHENELDKVIALENKVKVLDNIVNKTSQSVQTINMLNNKCRTSFAKPEFLKKDQRANPRLYDIGCYNDNLALMLAPEYEEVIRLEKESRSKLSDLIRPFDYDKLNNLYDLFVLHVKSRLNKDIFQKYQD
uniref:CCHC-type domain-containing protein n=1 Tax=Tanacetum cinerariifolium TaxID=118510 RepID=A0A6L2JDY6_TANCI|nr:hypothetical protein [Tanacetum cinerariifolium]